MLLRLAALGALGYAGYKYYQKNGLDYREWLPGSEDLNDASEVELAGGPLSDRARVQSTPDAPAASPA